MKARKQKKQNLKNIESVNGDVKKVMAIVGFVLLLMFIGIVFILTKEEASNINPPKQLNDATVVQVEFDVKDRGKFLVDLRNDLMPKTVRNFTIKVLEGFYHGRKFYRADDWMLCAGSPVDKEGYDTQKGAKLEKNDEIKFTKYVIGMAKNQKDGKSSKNIFFVTKADQTHFDGKYALFGTIADISSENVIDKIQLNDVITSARVVSFDGEPYVDSEENIKTREQNLKEKNLDDETAKPVATATAALKID